MKKRIFVFLIMLCVLFTGCSQPQSPLNEESENDTSNMTDENTCALPKRPHSYPDVER